MISSGILNDPSLIVAGDLNLTLSSMKIWGPSNNNDPLGDFFRKYFEDANLIDVVLSVLMPT